MTIQRYAVNGGVYPTGDGLFVYSSDHLVALAEKEEKIQAAMEAGKMLKEQRDKAEEEIVALTDENKQLRELVDCAEDIVELYGASRPGLTEDQEGWKKEWLRKARQALRGEEVGNEYY